MNDEFIRLLFLAHLGSTLFMVGLIWFVQVVHYPLFAGVGQAEFCPYELRHKSLTTWVVAPPMLLEVATAVILCWFHPFSIPAWSFWTGLALLGVIWFSTMLVQIPCHDFISKGFDADVHRRLVTSNWLRTIAWSVRGGLVLWMTWLSLG